MVDIETMMPEGIRQNMIVLKGKQYLPTAFRLVWFRMDHPDWKIMTSIIEGGHAAGYACVQATIMDANGNVLATAHKSEDKQSFPAGWVEKAETGAVGRALAMCGYGTQFDTTLLEGEGNPADAPVPAKKSYATAKVKLLDFFKSRNVDFTHDNSREILKATAPELANKRFSDFKEADWNRWLELATAYLDDPNHALLPGEDPYA